MRILLVSALLLGTASCAWAPQQAAICPAAEAMKAARAQHPVPAVTGAPAPPAVVAAAPLPAPAPVAAVYVPPIPNPGTLASGIVTQLFGPDVPVPPLGPAPVGRLTLSNFRFELAHVEALVTPYRDCAVHPGMVPLDLKLPLNSTWIVKALPGRDICWRRQSPGAPPQGVARGTAPAAPAWTEWNRVFTGAGRFVDAQL